jgi:hypothetical protein
MSTSTEKPWEEMTPCERNTHIGELIGAKPMSQLYLALDGKQLWMLPKGEDDLAQMRQLVTQWQEVTTDWKRWMKNIAEIQDEWRGRITVEVANWHIRYSETPGGGWTVIEHLREKGFPVTIYSEPANNWRILVKERAGDRAPGVNAVSPDIHVAACEVARRILDR